MPALVLVLVIATAVLIVLLAVQEGSLCRLHEEVQAERKEIAQKIEALRAGTTDLPAATPGGNALCARKLVELLFPVHPWHGPTPGDKAPETVNAVIEIVPDDKVKFELDKSTGMLRLDRVQRYSNSCPALYGFIPRSYCAELVGKACAEGTGLTGITGDGDPMDICVLTEKDVSHGNILVHARPIGGLRMIDDNKADDKIIAVLEGDLVYGHFTDICQLQPALVERLKHYFLTYKQPPGQEKRQVTITHVYSRQEAHAVIAYSLQDYQAHYHAAETHFEQLLTLIAAGAAANSARQTPAEHATRQDKN